ncbi:MAG: HlyD family efflux transporter periplasmic adaptor subunit, partial [Rhodospirillales bacterium]|nr:HlyD family efflux transporter periplasmic adaptor subunit [Rhodospirillales bacterium]
MNANRRAHGEREAAGWVQQRTVNTVGGVVKPGETLMRIVPDQRRLVVEAYLPSKDVGRVRAGQKAEIKLEAFNF